MVRQIDRAPRRACTERALKFSSPMLGPIQRPSEAEKMHTKEMKTNKKAKEFAKR
jgi:hypothetical protein